MTHEGLIDALGQLRGFPLAAALILATFVLEDAATAAGALLAAAGAIDPLLAAVSLWAGVVLGDLGLYGLGYAARKPGWAARWLARQRVQATGIKLSANLWTVLLAARVIPGTRLPTYLACGLFAVPFHQFALIVAVAVGGWTGALFTLLYLLGEQALDLSGPWRWLTGGAILATGIFLPMLLSSIRQKRVLS